MKTFVLGLLFCVLVAATYAGFNIWRYDADRLHASLLHLTPLGSSYDEVFRVASSHFSKVKRHDDNGFYRQDSSTPKVIGVKSIEAYVVNYYVPPFGATTVIAYWGFDKDKHLIEIWIWRTTDSI